MKLATRQIATVLGGVLWLSATAAFAAKPSIWDASAPGDSGSKSMEVYPLQLEGKQTRWTRTGFQSSAAESTDASETVDGLEQIFQPNDAMPEGDDPPPGDTLPAKPTTPGSDDDELRTLAEPVPAGTPMESQPYDSLISPDVVAPSGIEVSPYGAEPPAPVWSSGTWFRSGLWYTNADVMIVHRNRPNNRVVLGQDLSDPNRLFFNYGPSMGVEAGLRVAAGRFIGQDYRSRDHNLELGFLGFNEFESNTGMQSAQPGALVPVLEPRLIIGGFSGADIWTTQYASRFYSIDMNLRTRRRPELDQMVMSPDGTWTQQYTNSYVPSLLVGLRYVSLNEDFNWQSRASDLGPDEFAGDYGIEAENDLLGVQIGGDWTVQLERWYWGVRGKFGGYVNFAEQTSVVAIVDPREGAANVQAADRFERATRAGPAFFGEVNIMAAYNFTPDFSVRTSYDIMGLAGVALAPDQVTFNRSPPPRILTDGAILYQSLSLGLEYVW